ncbi:hypothetical protein O6H91_Y541900 [Diphasiastrum complanatum]|nr:hypothetical protein O6H91_Y541900 [Diphasiastrum complanatum]
MAWRQLMTQGRNSFRHTVSSGFLGSFHRQPEAYVQQLHFDALGLVNTGPFQNAVQKRYLGGYIGKFSRRLEQQLEREAGFDLEDNQVKLLRELNKVDPEGVIRWFEGRPLQHHNSGALAEYVKALVKVDRLDESSLLKALQRG